MHAGTLTPIVNNPDEAIMSPQVLLCTLQLVGSPSGSARPRSPDAVVSQATQCSCWLVRAALGLHIGNAPCFFVFQRGLRWAAAVLQMRDTVRQVAHLFPTAIISGRGRDKVEAFVQLPELFYAGSHGMDIAGPRVSLTGVRAGATTRCTCTPGSTQSQRSCVTSSCFSLQSYTLNPLHSSHLG